MGKRDLFEELVQGFDDLKSERKGKVTLKTTQVEIPKEPTITAKQIAKIREKYNYSQAVFAALLCTKKSTLQNWEQNRSQPNAQAKVLLKMVDENPEFLEQLSTFTVKAVAVKKSSSRTKAPARTKRKTQPKAMKARKKAPKRPRRTAAA